ncbi:hypothetical protein Avbf_02717 [Armadillidium vulgare]|nr:hypothetical protein Avbf_02717 [Armadillidium vulgare]
MDIKIEVNNKYKLSVNTDDRNCDQTFEQDSRLEEIQKSFSPNTDDVKEEIEEKDNLSDIEKEIENFEQVSELYECQNLKFYPIIDVKREIETKDEPLDFNEDFEYISGVDESQSQIVVDKFLPVDIINVNE